MDESTELLAIRDSQRTDFTKSTCIHDAVLQIGDREFFVVKAFLAFQSSFFKKEFYGKSKKKRQRYYTFDNIDSNSFHKLLEVIYPIFPRRTPITDDNVSCVLRVADQLGFQTIVDECEEHLLSSDCNISITERLFWSDEFDLQYLLNTCLYLIHLKKEFKQLYQSEKYKKLKESTQLKFAEAYVNFLYPED